MPALLSCRIHVVSENDVFFYCCFWHLYFVYSFQVSPTFQMANVLLIYHLYRLEMAMYLLMSLILGMIIHRHFKLTIYKHNHFKTIDISNGYVLLIYHLYRLEMAMCCQYVYMVLKWLCLYIYIYI